MSKQRSILLLVAALVVACGADEPAEASGANELALNIAPGASIQAAINANPPGTVFTLPAGIWHRQQFRPKVGNQFIGDPAGRTILTGDDVTPTIYGTDGSLNEGVLFKNIVVEHYGINAPECYLGALHGVAGWRIENSTFRFNNCAGLNVGHDTQVIGGRFNDNGHAGIQGYRAHRALIKGAEIARNNTRHDSAFHDAAGLKLVDVDGLQMINNYVHHNYGPGLWCDINCRNVLYEGNTVIGNFHAGIMYEVSTGTTIIRNNVSNDNGTTIGAAQIFVSSSNGTQVYGNNVRASGNANAITMQADYRPDALITTNNKCHNNLITFTTNQGKFGLPNYSGLVGTGNSSDYNSFFVANTADLHWMWNISYRVSWSQYRSSSGQDAHSTLQVGNRSVPGNTSGCPALTGCAANIANIALGRPAVAFSVYGASYPASAAFDGSPTTRWSSAFYDPQWIYVDLGATYKINRVKLLWEAAYGKSFKIQVSSNATTWTDIFSTTTNTALTNDLTGLVGTGRYVRMYGLTRGTVYGYSLYGMEVYGG